MDNVATIQAVSLVMFLVVGAAVVLIIKRLLR